MAARADRESQLRVHHALADALIARGEPEPEAIGSHLEAAGDHAQAARYYGEAAEQAARSLAFDHATHLYRRALVLGAGGDAHVAARLQAQLGDALANAGRGADAATAYLAAVEAAPGDEALVARCRRRAAEELLRSGHLDTGLLELGRALAGVGLSVPKRPLASLLWLRARTRLRGLRESSRASPLSAEERWRLELTWSASTALAMTDHMKGAVFQTQHLLYSLESGDPGHLARGLGLEAVFRSMDGAGARATAHAIAERALLAAERTQDVASRWIAVGAVGLAEYQLAEWQTALEKCDRAVNGLRREATGVWFEINTCELHSLWSLAYLGQMGELSLRVPRLLRETEERGDRYMTVCLCTDLPALAWLVRDDAEAGLLAVREVMRQWPSSGGYHVQYWSACLAEVNDLLYLGRGAEAWERAQREWKPLKRSLLLTMQMVRIEAMNLRARAALAAASAGVDREAAISAAEEMTRKLAGENMGHGPAFAALQSAALRALRGDADGACKDLEQAIARFSLTGMALHGAIARRRLGALRGGDEGARLIAEADRAIAAQRIVRRDRFTDLIAPGFPG
jgi:hypothetical protein